VNTFIPDLIIEVTGACNRACVGCYAPNVVSNKGAIALFDNNPELFLGVLALNNAMNELQEFPLVTSIRGGEPTLHPKLPILLLIASKKSDKVFLETHGRWLLPKNVDTHIELIQSIKKNNVIVKISFDKMHGMKEAELKEITEFLNLNGIRFRIAITEATLADYLETRSFCSWVSDDKIIFQQKAIREEELVKPWIGTINVRGELYPTHLSFQVPIT
jgi:organic radical activating enzyme